MKIYVVTCFDETWDGVNEGVVDILSGDAYTTSEEAWEEANKHWGGGVQMIELHKGHAGGPSK